MIKEICWNLEKCLKNGSMVRSTISLMCWHFSFQCMALNLEIKIDVIIDTSITRRKMKQNSKYELKQKACFLLKDTTPWSNGATWTWSFLWIQDLFCPYGWYPDGFITISKLVHIFFQSKKGEEVPPSTYPIYLTKPFWRLEVGFHLMRAFRPN